MSGTPFSREDADLPDHEHPVLVDDEGEEEGLLTVCKPHLRALIIAALETCCREGELLSLRWLQVRWDQNELFFPGAKTKSGRDVFIPMSQRLRAMLDMRALDRAGEPMGPTCYVFGNEIGERVKSVKRAWQPAVLKSHGYTPRWKNGALTSQSREEYGRINLHFHDLRREGASRLLEGDVPEQYVQAVLGHADLSTTSKYLATTRKGMHKVFALYEKRKNTRIRVAGFTEEQRVAVQEER